MLTVIQGGTIVTGDGRTEVIDGALIVEDGRIAGLERHWERVSPHPGFADVIDADGHVVMPGLINCHTHGVAPGPLFPSGAAIPTQATWRGNLDRHLLAGTTTVLSTCGLATIEQIREADRAHPVNVRAATSHTPSSWQAALAADGEGLDAAEKPPTVLEMLEAGAVAIGELGGGQTLGGGGQDVLYIPRAVEAATGVRISPRQARQIKEAALGRRIRPADHDPEAMARALAEAGLADRLDDRAARALISDCVMPSLRPSLESFREGAALSAQHGVPALMHAAAPTIAVMREVADRYVPQGARIIACHANHPSFTVAEAVELAVELSARGCLIEACTFDLLHGRELVDTSEHWDALTATAGLVDVMATDYGLDGRHDPLIAGVADLVRRTRATLPRAVALVTGAVARAIPGIAPGRGTLERGRIADVTIARADDLTAVRDVLVAGRVAVRDGAIVDRAGRRT